MKKLSTLLLVFLLTVSVISPTCVHRHDENCDYGEAALTGCTHECDDDCYSIDPQFSYGPDDEGN